MSDREALILLNMVEGLSPRKAKEFLSKLDKPKEIFTLQFKSLEAFLGKSLTQKLLAKRDSQEFKEELRLIEKEKIDIITILDEDYPSLLSEIYEPPFLLYLKGRRSLLNEKCFAVVGSRRASFYGLSSSERFSYSLAYLGLVIVSGLALGIDTYAHKGALEAGGGTLAVLGSGLLNIYPKQNKNLAQEITERGCLLSEFPLTMPPFPRNFPRRNRIISGLSLGVLVVEARLRSGALITANFALEQGREVFALPGGYNSPQSKGTHLLIKQGAKLIDSLEDILEELNVELNRKKIFLDNSFKLNLSDRERVVFEAVSKEAKDIETLFREAHLERGVLYQIILSLLMKGLIRELPGKLYIRR